MNRILAGALVLLTCGACSPGTVEYPHLSKLIDSHSAVMNELGVKTVQAVFMKYPVPSGFGYRLDGENCPGEYHVNVLATFDFEAEFNGDKWSVYAAADLMKKLGRKEATEAFELILNSLIKQCKQEFVKKNSWQQ